MKCNICKEDTYLVNGKCLGCYKLQAVETAEKFRDRLKEKAIEANEKISNRPRTSKWTYLLIKAKRGLFGFGEKILDKAIDKAVGKFSWIIGIVFIILIVGIFLKVKK